MENQSHSLIAGLFVVLLTLAVIAGALWLGPPKGPKLLPIDLVTRHSVSGLKADAPVQFRGVDIGHVESITFDPRQRGEIRVRVAVDPAAPPDPLDVRKAQLPGHHRGGVHSAG